MPQYTSEERIVIPPGVYETLVKQARETTSKAGNEMIVLECEVVAQSRRVVIREYLVFTHKNARRIDAVRAAFGYEVKPGIVYVTPNDFLGRKAKIHVGISTDDNGSRNIIERWIPQKPEEQIPF